MQVKGPESAVFVIFGAAGDLTWRKLIPAIYHLFIDGMLPQKFHVFGIDRKEMNHEVFIEHLNDGVNRFSRSGKADESLWKKFCSHLVYGCWDLNNPETYTELKRKLAETDAQWGVLANRVFYIALPPSLIGTISGKLAEAGLNQDRDKARIVIEKPFGRDLSSARELNVILSGLFLESQIFRIDHYLGKETVQNILAFRFANTLFEPIWDRRYIDHIQITVAEQEGVEHRGGYYDHAGALRDMIQNHLMQILCLIAMEAPVTFDYDDVRNKKVDVLHAIRPIQSDHVQHYAARGQYGAGWIEGRKVPGYQTEPGVSPDSSTETYAAVKLFIDNWRWQGVPFYLRTGKRLPARISEIAIQFRHVPHQTFPAGSIVDGRPNRLLIAIQPEEGIFLRFEVKHPGQTMRLSPVMMQFYYREAFKAAHPDAYETLLLDVICGDATLFMRADQAEAGWSALGPVLDMWENIKSADFPNYQSGSWGPEEADILIARDGHSWILPTSLQCHDNMDIAECRVMQYPS